MLLPAGRPRADRGFTLVEVLVVVFIIGVVVTMALMAVDTNAADERLEREARRLEAILGMASEEAILFGVELGFQLTPEGYRFLRLDTDGWTPVTGGDTPLRPHELKEGVRLQVIREDEERRRLVAEDDGGEEDDDGDEEDDTGPRPDFLFLSSGEITPFELVMTAEGAVSRYRYEGELTGELAMERVAEDRP